MMNTPSIFIALFAFLALTVAATDEQEIHRNVPSRKNVLNRSQPNPLREFFHGWAKKDNMKEGEYTLIPVETHPGSRLRMESSSLGWVYSSEYSDNSCKNEEYQYAVATNQCFLTKSLNGVKYSTMMTCGSGKVYSTRYTSLDCDASTKDGEMEMKLMSCMTADDDFVNLATMNMKCSSSETFPLAKGTWVMYGEYAEAGCIDMASYGAYLNGTCYVTGSTGSNSFYWNFPYLIESEGASDCSITSTHSLLGGACENSAGNDDTQTYYETFYAEVLSTDYSLYYSAGTGGNDDDDSNTNITSGAVAFFVIGVLMALGLIGGNLYYNYFVLSRKTPAPVVTNSAAASVTSSLH